MIIVVVSVQNASDGENRNVIVAHFAKHSRKLKGCSRLLYCTPERQKPPGYSSDFLPPAALLLGCSRLRRSPCGLSLSHIHQAPSGPPLS